MQSGRRFASMYVREAWRRALRRVALLRLKLFRHSIKVPERLIVAPTDLRSIDPHVADEILNGRFLLAGRMLETNEKSPFTFTLPSMPCVFIASWCSPSSRIASRPPCTIG
ncbi:hypothetical protein ACCT30_33615, partial [Rhizobium ruizarguesonis]